MDENSDLVLECRRVLKWTEKVIWRPRALPRACVSGRFQAGGLGIPDVWPSRLLSVPHSYTLGEDPETPRLTLQAQSRLFSFQENPVLIQVGEGRSEGLLLLPSHGLLMLSFYC